MPMPLIDFESSGAQEQQRLQAQQARKAMLEKVRAQHDAKRRQVEAAKKQGEDSWMLPSVEKSLLRQGGKKLSKKSKEKKHKKKKKKKKSKKDSSSSSDSSTETEWVEKSAARSMDVISEENSFAAPHASSNSPETQKLSRDDWMEMPSLFGTYTRDEMRQREGNSRTLVRQLEKKQARESDKPGSHALELNPYFKDGGSGLPQCAGERLEDRSVPVVGFGASAAWLKKSLQRAKEQAAEESVTLEEIAEKRWGSLDKFYKLLREAETRDAAAVLRSVVRCWSVVRSSDTTGTRRQKDHSDDWRRNSRITKESDERLKRRRKSDSPDRRTRSSSSNRSRSRSRSRRSRSRSRSQSRKRHRHEKQQSRKRNDSSSSSDSRSKSPAQNRTELRAIQSSRKREQSCSESGEDRKSHKRDLKKSSKFKDKRRSRRNRSSSYSSSTSEEERVLLKRDKFGGSSSYGSGYRSDDEDRHPSRRLLKPGESERSSVRSHDGRQERAVWENARRLPSSSAPASGAWRKRDPARHKPPHTAPEKDATSPADRDDEKDHMALKACKSPRHASAGSPGHAAPPASEVTNVVQIEVKPKKVYTTHELNQIGAKIVKAELVGNGALAEKLKKKLENARKETQEALAAGVQVSGEDKVEETVLLTTTDSKGFTRPITVKNEPPSSLRKTKTKTKTSAVGVDGARDKYFPDDHQFSLKQMFEQEKRGGTEDSDAMFVRAAARSQKASLDDDYTLDDSFVDKSAMKEGQAGQDSRDRMKAIMDHQRREQALASCGFCCDSKHIKKHLIISLGSKSYLSLPSHESLVEGHCLIVPRDHLATSTLLDEDAWLEMKEYRKSLVRFFASRDEDVVFLECCMQLRRQPHTVVHCLPLPRDLGDLAPIYFKKAIQESESEWNQNVKLVELKGRDVRRAIPRGFPYFAVDFGTSPGYAHVIEDEASFPRHFGQSVVGGMLDVETHLWRKPKPENFDQQRRKVLVFAKDYERFDPVQET
ncbi:Cwf19-like protein C-terminal domain-2 [Trinorchestia longiramus]|nr:Cwf19-like protein C-terminal domain-2 [Trinorchestia longiramus]